MYDEGRRGHYLNIFLGDDSLKNKSFSVQQGDYNSNVVVCNLYGTNENGKSEQIDLADKTITVVFQHENGKPSQEYSVKIEEEIGCISFSIPRSILCERGDASLQLKIYGDDSLLNSAVIPFIVADSIDDEDFEDGTGENEEGSGGDFPQGGGISQEMYDTLKKEIDNLAEKVGEPSSTYEDATGVYKDMEEGFSRIEDMLDGIPTSASSIVASEVPPEDLDALWIDLSDNSADTEETYSSVDTTLTQAGMAADAAETGSRLEELAKDKADKTYVIELFEELKALILNNSTGTNVALLDQAILDNTVLA